MNHMALPIPVTQLVPLMLQLPCRLELGQLVLTDEQMLQAKHISFLDSPVTVPCSGSAIISLNCLCDFLGSLHSVTSKWAVAGVLLFFCFQHALRIST